VLAPNTEVAAMHAAAEGLINVKDLRNIRTDRMADARKGS
jgi:hypothetical protein